ncbi:hypothetical protein PS6_009715 [Mucor atramentarius]
MPRIPIYPEVEKFITLKKRTKLKEVESDNKKENSTTQTPKRTSTQRKDSPALITAKRNAKRSRQASTSTALSSKNNCSSCQEEGHSSARSSQCKNYNPKLPERLQIRLGSHQRYTLSVPFETLCNDTPNKANALKKVKDISSFVREVLFKAQLFVNHFILQHPTKLTNDFFDQNFWYTISRALRERDEKVPLSFVGDRGYDINSPIKGHMRCGSAWKAKKHIHYGSVIINNEHDTSQTCLFRYSKTSHPQELVTKKNKQYLCSVNDASVCTNPDCVLRTKDETHKAHNSLSALAIGLAGFSTVIFRQPIPSFDPSFSGSKTEKLKLIF